MFNKISSPSSDAVATDAARGDAFTDALGARLVERGLLDHLALRRAQRARSQSVERLDVVLARLGLVAEDSLADVLGEQLGLPIATASEFPAAPILVERIEPDFLRSKRIVPLREEHDRLVVAVADPLDTASTDSLAFHLEMPVEVRLSTSGDIDEALKRLYGAHDAAALASETAQRRSASPEDDVRRLEDLASEAPVVRLVQDLIVRAVEARASDIHVEQRPESLCVRFRVDGILHTVERLTPDLAPGVISRIKILSRLDIAERRQPQDGRTRSVVRGRELDIRVSTIPAMSGESCVLRLLSSHAVRLDFPALGFESRMLAGLQSLLNQPHGIVLVTGPTGSGKTTTLYTALGTLDAEKNKILTVEDPVEYRLPGISQIQVQPRASLTFATALRSILRQDPDVIMIGEIRDLETAQIAIQASLTGHLVLSTVHTNSASATVTRLLDMGVESYLLASSVSGVLAQRLVRRLCPECATPHDAPASLIERLIVEAGSAITSEVSSSPRLMSRGGCPQCRNTGYSGRIAIGELLPLDKSLRELVHARRSDQEIERAAIAAGMTTLYQAGLAKALAGETALEEVFRVTRLN